MHRILRAVLIWVMVMAMPLQGLAASAMLACGPSHARMLQGLAAGGLTDSHAGHDHDHAAMAAESDLSAHAADTGDAAADMPCDGGVADNPCHQDPRHSQFSCSACAACCAALALPARWSLPGPSGLAQQVQVAPVTLVTSHQPDGLDRPPRPPLA